jgi:hypothetical protein
VSALLQNPLDSMSLSRPGSPLLQNPLNSMEAASGLRISARSCAPVTVAITVERPPNVVLLQHHRHRSRYIARKVCPPHRQLELMDLEACNPGQRRTRRPSSPCSWCIWKRRATMAQWVGSRGGGGSLRSSHPRGAPTPSGLQRPQIRTSPLFLLGKPLPLIFLR